LLRSQTDWNAVGTGTFAVGFADFRGAFESWDCSRRLVSELAKFI
jgi:hypothetical protein